MNTSSVRTQDGVFKRVLWLYGLFMLLSNAAYLVAYYLLPEHWLLGSATQGPGRVIAASSTFWSQVAMTFLFNFGLMIALSVWLNLFQVKGFPLGYLWLLSTAVMSGVTAGTNSFLQSNLTQINVRDGMAANLSIGGLEFLAYILVIAATVSIAVYQWSSWIQLVPTKMKNFRDVRLSWTEVLCLLGGIVLLLIAAYRETMLARSL